MNAFQRKEIRLLLPGWVTAMLLGVLLPLLSGFLDWNPGARLSLMAWGGAIGCCMLGLAGFGREVTARTFTLLLSQPRARREIWRTKMTILGGALGLWLLGVGIVVWLIIPGDWPRSDWNDMLWITLLAVPVIVSGGLWTTLLLRQIVAAFWISLLVPFTILVGFIWIEDESLRITLTVSLLILYAVGGYSLARWLFLNAQDVAWTGGNITLPAALKRWAWQRAVGGPRPGRPLRTLFLKELQFQQVNFMLAGFLFVLQAAALLARWLVDLQQHPAIQVAVDTLWILWMVMPLLVGCSVVAEERKLGTHEAQLSLPLARKWQYLTKLAAALLCGLALGGIVPSLIALAGWFHEPESWGFVIGWSLTCIGVTLAGVYASTLTSHLLQAFAVGTGFIILVITVGTWLAATSENSIPRLFGYELWRGPLVLVVGLGVAFCLALAKSWRRYRWGWVILITILMVAGLATDSARLVRGWFQASHTPGFQDLDLPRLLGCVLLLGPVFLTAALAGANFEHSQATPRLWRSNACIWLGGLAATLGLTTLIYHRVWESTLPFEPAAKPAVLTSAKLPTLATSPFGGAVFALLPDGRIWAHVPRDPAFHTPDDDPEFSPSQRKSSHSIPGEFLAGTNWVAMGMMYCELVAVRADGSLWEITWWERQDPDGSIRPAGITNFGGKNRRMRQGEFRITRMGEASDWATVAAGRAHFLALKRDGSLWGWGRNENMQLGPDVMGATNLPVKLSAEQDWTQIYAGGSFSYAVNQVGSIVRWGKYNLSSGSKTIPQNGPLQLDYRGPGVRQLAATENGGLILDTTGELWGVGLTSARWAAYADLRDYKHVARLGPGKWQSISSCWDGAAGIHADGTLWAQFSTDRVTANELRTTGMEQAGGRTDWVAAARGWRSVVALAKDGTVCRFGEEPRSEIELLAPTRRVTWSADVLSAAK